MFGDARRAVIVGGIVVFAAGVLVGFLLGRSGGEEAALSPGLTGPVAGPTAAGPTAAGPTAAVPTAAVPPTVVTPDPGQAPAIPTQGQVLLEADRAVVSAAATSACQSLVTPGSLGECGEVPVAGGRAIWVVERTATTAGSTAIRVRVFTFVPDAAGWVEWLQASDPNGDRWSDVNVLPTDLTGDGVAELVVGFRGLDERETLEYDIVGYGETGVPVVLAHPESAARGVIVVSAGQLQEFAAQYPNDEAACCPPSYLRRTIGYDAGFFRVLLADEVPPTAVPASQV
ncbi:MAG: hypothetical protein ACXWX2_10900 [Actinomycetota bacterium]